MTEPKGFPSKSAAAPTKIRLGNELAANPDRVKAVVQTVIEHAAMDRLGEGGPP